MSQIKDDNTAKKGISGLFGNIAPQSEGLTPIRDKKVTKEEIVGSLSDETKEALQKEIQRRQYLKAGRPPKGSSKKVGNTIPMTFRITPEKQNKLRDIALKEGLFIGEVLDRAIDLLISDFDKKEGRK